MIKIKQHFGNLPAKSVKRAKTIVTNDRHIINTKAFEFATSSGSNA